MLKLPEMPLYRQNPTQELSKRALFARKIFIQTTPARATPTLENTTKRIVIYAVVGLSLAGCASAPPPEFQSVFTTHIFDNGNKQFTLRLVDHEAEMTDRKRPPRPQGRPPRAEGGGRKEPPKRSPRSPVKAPLQESIKPVALTKLDQVLAGSGYCREGYWLLDEQFHGALSKLKGITLKGECHELANDDDIARFINLKSDVIRASDFKERLAPPPANSTSQ